MKHQIEDLVFKETIWARPYKTETVWEMLSHLAALSPRGAVIWEVRSKNGKVSYLIGAATRYIRNIEEAIKAHCDIQFHEVGTEKRAAVTTARQLKISNPTLSLKTDIMEAVIRAGLAALTEDKSGTEMVMQIVLGRAYAPPQYQLTSLIPMLLGCKSYSETCKKLPPRAAKALKRKLSSTFSRLSSALVLLEKIPTLV